MKKTILYFLFPFLCFSCSKQENKSIEEFDTVEYIESYDSIFSDVDEPFGVVVEIHVFGNMLVLNHANGDYQFSFIDIESGKNVCRWGTIGEGAGEFIDFSSNFSIEDSCLVFQTFARKEINYVPLRDILNRRTDMDVRKETYPYTVDFRPRRVYSINENRKVAVGAFKEGLLGILGKDNTLMSCESDLPFPCDEVEGIYRGNLFQSQVITNGEKNRFAVFFLASDVFEIYEINGEEVRKVYVSSFKSVPQIQKTGERWGIDYDNSIAGFTSLSASSEWIGCSFSSQSYAESAAKDGAFDEILCFDWNGRKVKKYILPFAINRFCMDADYIYGVRYVDDKTVIYRFPAKVSK
ncbi:BF3164 family lipoprotein [uncultured Phocaeicola sp.]|uniref:BF3164 family lipoprotein n=1 Tax=uncultured Phocaeicola sp. TaxID=990718 RepID=UPI000E93E083|nr:BF3164 family lipoprotein [uncultured Phocaeicola sp.]GFI01126.1 hypothetical protein IMSAGC004_03537 [Bacteroidaceae bacterium]HBV82708.1 hypothetical protein [Lachnospiraceae bacterium]